MEPTCILITGIPHAGTRLLVQILNEHPDVSVPLDILDYVMEHSQIIYYYTRIMDATPIYSSEYVFDEDEMRFFMDMYKQSVDLSKPYYVFKAPIYPMMWLDWLVDYFEGKVKLVYTTRSPERIFQSFVNKGQDELIFWRKNDNAMMSRFIKYLPPDRRMYYLATYDKRAYFYEMIEYYDSACANWNSKHPELPFTVFDIEKVTASRDSLSQFVQDLGLDEARLDTMFELVDHERLYHRTKAKQSKITFKNVMRLITPPALWSLGRNLVKR